MSLSMADAVVSGIVGNVVGRAISLLAGQLQDRQGGVEGKLRQLRHLVVKLESVVEAAEARRITSRPLLAWLSELVDGAYQGLYCIDAFRGEESLDEDDGGEGGLLRRPSFLPSSLNPAKRLRVAARRLLLRANGGDAGGGVELDGVLANLQSVSGDLAEFIMLLQSCPPAAAPYRPLATNIYADCQMFGRHLERRRVLDFLLHDDDGGDGGEVAVLPVIGRAGLGKTTLVQHVCDDPAVRRRFSLIVLLDFHCMTLTVAGDGETARLLRSLFAVAAGDGEPPLRLLERKLRGERFLAVFDNVDPRKKQVIVDAIMPALRRGGRPGSRVIVTGADKHVAADLGTAEPVVLRPLPPAEYWFFFKAQAFGSAGDAEADPRLAAAGQAIAKRLRGSFFGAKVVGAMLRSRPDARVWRRVLASSYAEPSWLGNGGYVEAVACSLLPPHVTVRGVAVSGSPVRGLVGLQDAALMTAPPPRDGGGGGGHRPELPVLLCKLVFPSYCLYYTAYCTIDGESKQ